jgi:pimeloyl-ACP methyl ester carboxylesterase
MANAATKVFVHGNPETADIWTLLIQQLRNKGIDNIVTLSPPGFGAPTPAGWNATAIEYRDWLIAELESIGGDIDLVGHDWGAGHVYSVLAARPDIVRTWAADCAGLLHPDYVWHDAAQGWQTPDVGEQMVAGMIAMDADSFAEVFGGLGMTDPIARAVKAGLNDETARCILALYRDAAQPYMSRLGERVFVAQPRNGLVIMAENDTFAGSIDVMEEVAGILNADTAFVGGVGHWWMCEKPEAGAQMLLDHWNSF